MSQQDDAMAKWGVSWGIIGLFAAAFVVCALVLLFATDIGSKVL